MKPLQKKSLRLLAASLTMILAVEGPLSVSAATNALDAVSLSQASKSSTKKTSSKKTSSKKKTKKTTKKLTRKQAKRQMTLLKNQISKYIKNNCPEPDCWSVYVKNLETNQSFLINNRQFYSASTIKLFAMGAAYYKIKLGKLKRTSVLEDKIYRMIAYSDNDCFNSIVGDYVGLNYVKKFLKKYKFSKTWLEHGMRPGSHPFINSSMNTRKHINSTSARDCGIFLEKVYCGEMVSKFFSKKMLKYLKQQTFRYKIPSGIPSGVTVANKTGESDTMQHDAAIVYGKKTDYIICVFSNTDSPGAAPAHIREISRRVYNYLNKS